MWVHEYTSICIWANVLPTPLPIKSCAALVQVLVVELKLMNYIVFSLNDASVLLHCLRLVLPLGANFSGVQRHKV